MRAGLHPESPPRHWWRSPRRSLPLAAAQTDTGSAGELAERAFGEGPCHRCTVVGTGCQPRRVGAPPALRGLRLQGPRRSLVTARQGCVHEGLFQKAKAEETAVLGGTARGPGQAGGARAGAAVQGGHRGRARGQGSRRGTGAGKQWGRCGGRMARAGRRASMHALGARHRRQD